MTAVGEPIYRTPWRVALCALLLALSLLALAFPARFDGSWAWYALVLAGMPSAIVHFVHDWRSGRWRMSVADLFRSPRRSGDGLILITLEGLAAVAWTVAVVRLA